LRVLSLEIARINSSKKETSPPALSFREGADDDKKKYLTNFRPARPTVAGASFGRCIYIDNGKKMIKTKSGKL
jgi:hypothetical protein